MFGFACDETPQLMPLPLMLAHAITRRLAAVRRDDTVPALLPDGKAQVTVRYRRDADGRARGRRASSASSSPRSTGAATDMDELRAAIVEHVVRVAIPAELLDDTTMRGRGLRAREPDRALRGRRADGRRGTDGPQDHRRHLRRHGAPRRRRVLGQGSDQGRPLGRLRLPLGGQEHRRRRALRAAASCRSHTPSASRTR